MRACARRGMKPRNEISIRVGKGEWIIGGEKSLNGNVASCVRANETETGVANGKYTMMGADGAICGDVDDYDNSAYADYGKQDACACRLCRRGLWRLRVSAKRRGRRSLPVGPLTSACEERIQ